MLLILQPPLMLKMPPKSALFISKQWCDQIFDGYKTWELRSFPLPENRKRKPIAIAMSKCNCLVGEVTFDKCLRVGRRSDDSEEWEPVSQSEKHKKHFFLNPRNEVKCGFNSTNVPRVISKYREMYAWKMTNILKYPEPKKWKPKRGAVIFCDLDGTDTADDRMHEVCKSLPSTSSPHASDPTMMIGEDEIEELS